MDSRKEKPTASACRFKNVTVIVTHWPCWSKSKNKKKLSCRRCWTAEWNFSVWVLTQRVTRKHPKSANSQLRAVILANDREKQSVYILTAVLLGCVASRLVIGWRLYPNNSTATTDWTGGHTQSVTMASAMTSVVFQMPLPTTTFPICHQRQAGTERSDVPACTQFTISTHIASMRIRRQLVRNQLITHRENL